MIVFDQLKKNDPQLRTITWSVLIGMGILLAGLWYVQVISHRHYTENLKAQSFRTVRIPAIRGKILDRNGVPLAENQPVYNVNLYLDELRRQFKDEWQRSRPARKLTKAERAALEAQTRYRVVSNIVWRVANTLQQPVFFDLGQFLRHYTNQLALPMTLVNGLDPALVARFLEQPSNLPGVDLEIQPSRLYPQHLSAAHVLGFLTRDDSSAVDEDAFFNFRLPDYRGKVGIEGAFDSELRGRAGVKYVLVNSLGYRQSENIWTPAEPGNNITLTIDLGIQRAAERALQSAGPDIRGAVVVLDPNNGDIIALVSAPAYDPNIYIPRLPREEAARLEDPLMRPQINRATQDNYAPGSIFKIVTALACLEAGLDPQEVVTVQPDPFRPGKGCIFVGRRRIEDTAAPGEYDFRRAFIRSSNSYFITNGLRAGVEAIVAIGHRLHLGERCELPTRQEVAGTFPSLRQIRRGWTPGETANLCIGQGYLDVTPLQMAVMTAAIANGGKVLWPRLVQRVEPAEGEGNAAPVTFPAPRVRDELGVRPRSLELVREAMLADVEDAGTGAKAFVAGLRVCGKTGTAQVTDTRGNVVRHILWFASFAPYESPRYSVVVMVEGSGSGGNTCAPIAGKIYNAILSQEGAAKLAAVSKNE
jgi:penicillin-binding protein 2